MTKNVTPKGQAAKWTRANKTTWNVDFKGYQFEGVKQDGTWTLFLLADEPVPAVESSEKTLRGFWNEVTEYFKTNQALVLAAIAFHDKDALETVTGETAEDEPETSEPAATTDECPKCHKSGDEKCVTGSGKKVKENGGYHAVRVELREALGL